MERKRFPEDHGQTKSHACDPVIRRMQLLASGGQDGANHISVEWWISIPQCLVGDLPGRDIVRVVLPPALDGKRLIGHP